MRQNLQDTRSRTTPRPIAGVFNRVLKNLGISKRYNGWLVVSKWAEIVGDPIARHSHAIDYEEGCLTVAVPDATWRHNLALETDRILASIHSYPYGNVIRKLRFVRSEKGT